MQRILTIYRRRFPSCPGGLPAAGRSCAGALPVKPGGDHARRRGLAGLLAAALSAGAAFALSAGASFAIDSLPSDNAKYRKVKTIYDNVARAFGDARIPPRLFVTPLGAQNRNSVAWSDPGTEGAIGMEAESAPLQEGYIAIEEGVYDLFAPLGEERDGALAFLLGHELTHYYLRHGWVGDFGNSFATYDVGRKMIKAASYEEVIKRETEADYFGGFYGRLAGYDTLGVAPKALEMIYAAYELPDKLLNYPSRAERKAIAERAEANLRKMTPVFEAGNRLLLLEKYEEAGRLFEHLAHSFPSREMFNNAGTAYACEALRLAGSAQAGFAYPFEFDSQTRLQGKSGRSKGIDDLSERRTRLLQRAADNLDKATQRDRGYAAAYVNLSAVDTLLGDRDNAVILANRAMELARKDNETNTVGNALVARGLAWAEGGNKEKAMIDMAAAGNLGNAAAVRNLALLRGEQGVRAQAARGEKSADRPETVGGVAARDSFTRDKEATTFSLKGAGQDEPTLTVYARQAAGWQNIVVAIGSRLVHVIATGKGYDQPTALGVKIGSSLEEVWQKYGQPSRVLSARRETYYVYGKSEVVFGVNHEGKVSGWMTYAVQ